jgi:hypothetical protein
LVKNALIESARMLLIAAYARQCLQRLAVCGRSRSLQKLYRNAPWRCVIDKQRQSAADIKQAAAYGNCIVADYQSVHQDMCSKEFARLKDCYLVSCSASPYDGVLINKQKAAKKP